MGQMPRRRMAHGCFALVSISIQTTRTKTASFTLFPSLHCNYDVAARLVGWGERVDSELKFMTLKIGRVDVSI